MYDLAIIGGGPAGVGAGVYASRKRLKTIFITKNWEGQSSVSDGIENWIGTIKISGAELSRSLENHIKAYASDVLDIKENELCEKIEKIEGGFSIKTNKSEYKTKTILITTGSSRKKLDVPGAVEFENKGITYCATCDGPVFSDQDVAVIGGGNAAFESAAQLAAYCKSVTILNRSDKFRADEKTVEKIKQNPKIKIITNAITKKIFGEKFVTGLDYEKDGQTISLPITGVFVEIGAIPAVSFAKDLVKLNESGNVVVDPRTQATSISGIWAAGDCTDGLYHQNNIAVGDAVKALENIHSYLHA